MSANSIIHASIAVHVFVLTCIVCVSSQIGACLRRFLWSTVVPCPLRLALLQRNDAIRLKEEYYGFLDRISIILFFFSSTLLLVDHFRQDAPEQYSLTPPYMACVQVFLCWLLYVYTALALRENVLKVRLVACRVTEPTLHSSRLMHLRRVWQTSSFLSSLIKIAYNCTHLIHSLVQEGWLGVNVNCLF